MFKLQLKHQNKIFDACKKDGELTTSEFMLSMLSTYPQKIDTNFLEVKCFDKSLHFLEELKYIL